MEYKHNVAQAGDGVSVICPRERPGGGHEVSIAFCNDCNGYCRFFSVIAVIGNMRL